MSEAASAAASATSAAASATTAAAAASAAELIVGLTGEDVAVAALVADDTSDLAGALVDAVGDPGHAFGGALSATIAAEATLKPTTDLGDWSLLRRDTSDVTKGVAWTTAEVVVARALGWAIVTDDTHAGGADPTGVIDCAAAVAAAQASLPSYSGGYGSGVIFFPAGTYKHESTLTLTEGVSIRGAGKHATLLRGTVAGPLLDTATDGTGNPLTDYVDIRDMYVVNQSTNIAAKAARFRQMSHLTLRDCHFSSSASGAESCSVQVTAVYDFDAYRCTFAGVGPDRGLDFPGTYSSTIVKVNHCTFGDTKAAARFINGSVLEYEGNHHENIAGSPATNGGIVSIDSWKGGSWKGNYYESSQGSALVVYGAVGPVRGFGLGFNFITNVGSPAIDISRLSYSTVFPNFIKPGAISPNQNGIVLSSLTDNVVLHRQYLDSGTGAAHTTTGATNLTLVGVVGGLFAITVTAAGNWNIDRSLGEHALIFLNASGGSGTITNPSSSAGQRFTITLVQDATGGRTFTWPANCKFAGGAAPADTTASRRTTVSFVQEGGGWQEVSRAVAVG